MDELAFVSPDVDGRHSRLLIQVIHFFSMLYDVSMIRLA